MRSSSDVDDSLTRGHYSDPPLLVLTSLAAGPKHGHAMLDDIEQMCGTRLGPGTLYGAITRLEQRGLIEALPPDDRRRPYKLTESGRSAFAAKMATLQQFVSIGAKRLVAG